jgi:hypothetical protein
MSPFILVPPEGDGQHTVIVCARKVAEAFFPFDVTEASGLQDEKALRRERRQRLKQKFKA